jgi:hypothetical protein
MRGFATQQSLDLLDISVVRVVEQHCHERWPQFVHIKVPPQRGLDLPMNTHFQHQGAGTERVALEMKLVIFVLRLGPDS